MDEYGNAYMNVAFGAYVGMNRDLDETPFSALKDMQNWQAKILILLFTYERSQVFYVPATYSGRENTLLSYIEF